MVLSVNNFVDAVNYHGDGTVVPLTAAAAASASTVIVKERCIERIDR